MSAKFTELNAELYAYVTRHRSGADDAVLRELRRETAALGEISMMQVSEEQGSLLTLLTAAIGSRRVLEIGTFTGYSSICIARGLGQEGRLLCLDKSAEWTGVARRYWERAGVAGHIELRVGDGASALASLPAGEPFDFVFIDADKPGYDTYYELALPRVRPNGLLLFDNMLYHGEVLTGASENARAIDALNAKLANDPRVEAVLLPLADGLMLCRKIE